MYNLFKKIIAILKNEKVQFLGVLGEQNSANVYDFKEVVAKASNPVWVEKKRSEWKTFKPQFQATSSSCVAYTVAKIAQILFFNKTKNIVKFSPGWIYRQRSPKVEGMWIDNAVAIASGGLPTEEIYPSEGLSEVYMNNLPDVKYASGVAKEFAISPNWINLPIDFDTVAGTVQATNKGIMAWFTFGNGEWFNKAIPKIIGSYTPYRHSVTITDVILYQGVKYLVIEDSADHSGEFGHQKLINENFFRTRCLLARYPLNFKFDKVDDKPKYDGSIKSLQDCLKYEGVMLTNVPSTGYFGDITKQAVKDFQKKYSIPMTGYVGPITESKLKELFN